MKFIKIKKATYEGNLKVSLLFNDCTVKTIDFGAWIRNNPHPQYNRYLDEKSFMKFYIDEMGNIAWGKNRDLYFPIEALHNGIISM